MHPCSNGKFVRAFIHSFVPSLWIAVIIDTMTRRIAVASLLRVANWSANKIGVLLCVGRFVRPYCGTKQGKIYNVTESRQGGQPDTSLQICECINEQRFICRYTLLDHSSLRYSVVYS